MSNRVSRRGFLASAAGITAAAQAPRRGAGQPNVLVFFTDQQRWDTVGAYGGPMGLTPNLDRFAARGVRFEHAFTPQPVCAPARGTLQTGKYPTATGVIHNGLVLKDDELTIAPQFKAHGYQTGYIGKWHLGGTGPNPVPLARRGGFDEWWTAADAIEHTSHPYEGRVFDRNNKPIAFSGKYRVDFLTDLALDFLRKRQPKPFFLFVSYLEPHHQNDLNAFVAPNGYAERYHNNFYIPPDLASYPGDWKSQLPNYYGCVARLDECFGRLMDELKTQGAAENTVVAFTTDHGCHFRTRNNEYKRSCQDASIRVPLVIGGPGFEPGRVVPELVSNVHLAPTLLDAAAIPALPSMQGRSMIPLAHGSSDGWRNEVFVQMREVELSRALRTDRWKYCVYDPANTSRNDAHSLNYTERHFYDLRADPAEHVNLIGRGEYKDVAEEMKERLIANMKAAGEPEPKITSSRFYA